MRDAAQIVGIVNLVAFAGLGLVAFAQWRRRRDRAALWAMLTFGALGVVVVVGRLVPEEASGTGVGLLQRAILAVLLVFPYLLYRFTTAFDRPGRRLELAVSGLTAALVAWTFALPDVPAADEPRSTGFLAYTVAFVAHWAGLSSVAAWRLWRAGRGQPGVARRRMRLLAFAAAALTVALLLAAVAEEAGGAVQLASQLLALLSAGAFLLGLAPPVLLRVAWRRREQERLSAAVADLMRLATAEGEVLDRVLPPMTEIVGARAVALVRPDGATIGTHGDPAGAPAEPLRLEASFGELVVWTSPYAPFFGDDELRLLRTLASLTALALDRARLFGREREARLALERADELKSRFVALAAHELRTPVASVHGLASSLVGLRERLTPEQRLELEDAIAGQSARLTALVDQLLDLSRVDADAVPIEPTALDVRGRIAQLVAELPPGARGGVELDVPLGLVARVDPNAFDRIVGNLLTNAARYGAPPVRVSAEQRDRHFRLAVEDRGPGVDPAFAPDLFERFSRGEGSRRPEGGTGLGLAIARSYARAHGGEVLYLPASPHGARFEVVLPRPAEPA